MPFSPPRRIAAGFAVALAMTLALGCTGLGRPNQIDWKLTLTDAMSEANAEAKLIVAFIFTDWCGWCRRMDAGTWTDEAVIAESVKHVFLRLDAEKDPDGIRLSRDLGIRGFPIVLLLNADGSEFERLEGYMPPEKFLERLTAARENPESFGNLRAAEKEDSANVQILLALGQEYFNRTRIAEARTRFEKIGNLDPQNKSGAADVAMFYLAACQAGQEETDAALATVERLRKLYPESDVTPRATLFSAEILAHAGRVPEAKSRIEDFLKRYPGHPLAERARRLLAQL